MIELKINLTGSIGYSFPLYTDLNISLSLGKVYCVMGPNGSGKSTLLKTLSGSIPPLKGSVEMLPKVERIYLPPDPPSLPGMKGGDVALSLLVANEQRILYRDWLEKEELERVERFLRELGASINLDKDFEEFSTGEKMKILLASSLASKAGILLLDEPMGHLDIRSRLSLYKIFRRERKTRLLVISIHEIAEASLFCDEGVVLDAKKIIGPTSLEEILKEDLLSQVYGVKFKIIFIGGRSVPIPIQDDVLS